MCPASHLYEALGNSTPQHVTGRLLLRMGAASKEYLGVPRVPHMRLSYTMGRSDGSDRAIAVKRIVPSEERLTKA